MPAPQPARITPKGWPLLILLMLLPLVGSGCDRASLEALVPMRASTLYAGTLRVTAHAPSGGEETPIVHRTRWVRGPSYDGMEDNDLRGFLDGRFIYGWNQPTQVHSRLGRRGSRPRWGETELFRTLVRWGDVRLPPGATVREASLTLSVEKGPNKSLDVMLYAVQRDWNPGDGGEQRNNTSPPKPGESWWNAAREGEEPWGHPGVGFASETHPDADTSAMVLAEAHFEPRDETLTFRSDALARFVEERATAGAPIGLLAKLSDAHEDTPDTVLYIYTGNHGDFRNPARRPVLEVVWEAPAAVAALEREVSLEPGRSASFERLATPGLAWVAASFEPAEGHEVPYVEVRGAAPGAEPEPWQPIVHPLPARWEWLEVRALAAHDPLALGDAFETALRDTWVRTAPPEEQDVVFTFVSPDGEESEVRATYEGDYTWRVSFTPDALGRWRYRFRSQFEKFEKDSPYGVFDVLPGDILHVEAAMRTLLARIHTEYPELDDTQVQPLAPRFWQLERALYQVATPAEIQSPKGREIYGVMTQIRAALSGRRVPEHAKPSPMRREF